MNTLQEKRFPIESVTLSFLLSFLGILTTINVIWNRYISYGSIWDTLIIYAVFFGLLAYQFLFFKKPIKTDVVFFWYIFFILLFFTYIFFPKNSVYYLSDITNIEGGTLFTAIFFSLIGYALARNIKDINEFLHIFEIFSVITIILSVIQYAIGIEAGGKNSIYMNFSYNMLLQVVFLAILLFKQFKWYRLILVITGCALIFIAGCRGALVGLGVSIIIYIFFYSNISFVKKFLLLMFLITTLMLLYLYFYDILKVFYDFLNSINIFSRTIEHILEGQFFDDSGRVELYDVVIKNLNILGHGLWGDKVILGDAYVHNIILEILCDFGIIFGTVIIVFLLYVIFKAFKRSNPSYKIILCSLLSTGVVKLFFSSTMLAQEPGFYTLLGFCGNILINKIEE